MPDLRSPTARAAAGVATLLAVFAVAFRELLAGRLLFALDVHQTFVPLREALGRAWVDGAPLWDGGIGNGLPLAANPLVAAWYPPNVLFAFGDAPTLVTWLTAAHAVLGAFGARALAVRSGQGRVGAWVVAAVYGLNGVALSATAFANLAWSAAWLPWLVERWLASVDTRRPAAVAGAAITLAMMLTIAEPFVLLAASPALVAISVGAWRKRGAVSVVPHAASLAIGGLLAAPSLLATGRYVPESVRAVGFAPEATMYWSAHPGLTLGMLLPGVFGDARADGLTRFWATALSPEKGFPLLVDPYLGGVALVLAVTAVVGSPRRLAPWLAWGGLLALLAVGRHGPFGEWLARVPPFDALRYPIKWLVPATVPFALLAGAGVDALRDGKAWRRLAIVATGTLGLVALVALLALPALESRLDRMLAPPQVSFAIDAAARELARGTLLAGVGRAAVWLGATAALAWLVATRLPAARRSAALLVLAGLVAADLAWRAPVAAPSAPASLYRTQSPIVAALGGEAVHRVWVVAPPYVELTLDPAPTSALERARRQRAGLFGYTGSSAGLSLAFNPDVGQTRPLRYARLGSMVRQAPSREKAMLLGAAGVSHVVGYEPLEASEFERLAVVGVGAERPAIVTRNRLRLERVRLVPEARVYADDAAFIAAVIDGPRELFREATLIAEADLVAAGLETDLAPAAGPASLEVVHDGRSRLTVRTSGAGGWLVVGDVWTPGWRATVDGTATPVVPADYAFRAVRVPSGRRTVELRYRPW